jgi:large subunit ribosomal protein L20
VVVPPGLRRRPEARRDGRWWPPFEWIVDMPRVKRGNKRRERRRKILGLAKGYFLTKSKLYRSAQQAIVKAGNSAYVGRRIKKRDFRRLWIIRINAAARLHDMSYSRFMSGLSKAGVTLDRKSLADIAACDPQGFAKLVESARSALA